jgi:hypothetical protein
MHFYTQSKSMISNEIKEKKITTAVNQLYFFVLSNVTFFFIYKITQNEQKRGSRNK